MKIEHFRSDWNGMKSNKPYNDIPNKQTVQQAQTLGKVVVGNAQIFASERVVEVREWVGNGIAGNVYRDFYRIIQ